MRQPPTPHRRTGPFPKRRRGVPPTVPGCAAVAAALLFSGCTPLVNPEEIAAEDRGVVEGQLVEGGDLVIGLDQEPDALDPTLATTLVGRHIFDAMCEKLYDVDGDLDLVPQLADGEPETSEDGLQVTIPLRADGVLFNDGTPFGADAVKQSLDRHRELPGSVRATELESVEAVEAPDDSTVVLRLSRPDPALPATLADRAGMVMSPAAMDELGEDFAQAPECVGPFGYVERVAQDRVVLERSEHYYDSENVLLDRLIYRAIPDGTIRLANLRSGQLDVIQEVDPHEVAQVEEEDGLHLLSQPSLQYMGLTVNVLNADGVGNDPRQFDGPLAEHPELREALSLALNREAINEVVFNSVYQPACGPIPPISEFATEATLACPDHDPERAAELVEESGVDTPVTMEMMIPNDPTNVLLGEVIQSMAGDVGFDVRLRPTEFASSIATAQAGDFESYVQGWSGRVDPDGNIGQFHLQGGGNNYSGHFTEETDELIVEAASETDDERRTELYDELVPQLQETNSIIYLFRNRLYNAHHDGVAGIELRPDGLIRAAEAGHVQGQG